MRINPLKSLGQVFLATVGAISIFSILSLIRGGDAWLGLTYLLILMLPLSGFSYLWWQNRSSPPLHVDSYVRWSNFLFSLLGVSLAFWAYDLATTFYAIDVARVAYEVNPLGWPLGALGAFTYYAPTVVLTYMLLFRIRQKTSLYAAVPIAVVALLMGSMNLHAAIGNFQFFLTYAFIPAGIRYNLLFFVIAVDLVYAAVLGLAIRRQLLHRQATLVQPNHPLC